MSERPSAGVVYHNRGRVVVVSGGGSGIGLAVCTAFQASQAEVVALDIDAASAARLPPGVAFRQCDVASEEECRAAIAWTTERWGGLDVLVNNAAIQPVESYAPLHALPAEVWQRMLAVNFSGYSFLAKHALAVMRRQSSGVVVNIASAQGHRTARQVGAYGPIKAGTIMQARQWGVEYAREGIRVVSVSPGAVDTPLVRASLEAQGGEAELANRHPLGRLAQPVEIAQAVLWLASDDASFVTATDLEVDGGLGALAAFADPYPSH